MSLLMTSLSKTKRTRLVPSTINTQRKVTTGSAKVIAVALGFFLVGCSATNTPAMTTSLDTNVNTTLASSQRMDTQCIEQVNAQQASIDAPSLSQSLSLANTALHCVGDIQYSPAHADVKIAMQFSALAFVNFIQAGDIVAATKTLAAFRQKFPQQDLLFADYTSFVDTATVLVEQHDLSSYQLTSLNINPTLRDEITRQRKWSLR